MLLALAVKDTTVSTHQRAFSSRAGGTTVTSVISLFSLTERAQIVISMKNGIWAERTHFVKVEKIATQGKDNKCNFRKRFSKNLAKQTREILEMFIGIYLQGPRKELQAGRLTVVPLIRSWSDAGTAFYIMFSSTRIKN